MEGDLYMENRETSENKALVISSITTLVLAVTVIITVVGLFASKIKKDRVHDEKWKDYDECGLS